MSPAVSPPTPESTPNNTQALRSGRTLKPKEYAKAVLGYSKLADGAGHHHTALGQFLTSESTSIDIDAHPHGGHPVNIYPLSGADNDQISSTRDSNPDEARTDQSTVDGRPLYFHSPAQFSSHTVGLYKHQSRIIFMRGYMTADWINHIGARHMVDPEFFCRHLDFRAPEDSANSFSIPALPSSSWHLIELPFFTIGTKIASRGLMQLDKIEALRKDGAAALLAHHHRISKLASSGMRAGESMVRGFYVLDETHFAIEQRMSICMQTDRVKRSFSLLVWLDAGNDLVDDKSLPWSVHPPRSYYLPTVRHRYMVALKCHLFQPSSSDTSEGSARRGQSAASLPTHYGWTLKPAIMSRDALYSLNEVFGFAASSQMQFLNLIDVKLDGYSSLATQDLQILPSLRYIQQILYNHMQKTIQILNCIDNSKSSKWPKDETPSGSRKATTALQNLEQDFKHLLRRATALHDRTSQSISTLMSTVSIAESKRAIVQAERIGKLTFLAFVFVPLSFVTSFFGMNIAELGTGGLGLQWWAVLSVAVLGISFAVFFLNTISFAGRVVNAFKLHTNNFNTWRYQKRA